MRNSFSNKNYYNDLSAQQKEKQADKKGAMFFYAWYDTLHNDFSLEVAGALMLAVLHYDRYCGAKPIPKDLREIIASEKAAPISLKNFCERSEAATRDWINRHKPPKVGDSAKGEKEDTLDEELPF